MQLVYSTTPAHWAVQHLNNEKVSPFLQLCKANKRIKVMHVRKKEILSIYLLENTTSGKKYELLLLENTYP